MATSLKVSCIQIRGSLLTFYSKTLIKYYIEFFLFTASIAVCFSAQSSRWSPLQSRIVLLLHLSVDWSHCRASTMQQLPLHTSTCHLRLIIINFFFYNDWLIVCLMFEAVLFGCYHYHFRLNALSIHFPYVVRMERIISERQQKQRKREKWVRSKWWIIACMCSARLLQLLRELLPPRAFTCAHWAN